MATRIKASRLKSRSMYGKNSSLTSNKSTVKIDDVLYGIDWNTGLSWMRTNGCPPVFDFKPFETDFSKYRVTNFYYTDRKLKLDIRK